MNSCMLCVISGVNVRYGPNVWSRWSKLVNGKHEQWAAYVLARYKWYIPLTIMKRDRRGSGGGIIAGGYLITGVATKIGAAIFFN